MAIRTFARVASRVLRAASLAALLAVLGADVADAQRGPPERIGRGVPAGALELNPPTVTSSLPPGTAVFVGEELRFAVTVTHPDGHPVSLDLVNPPPGLVFHPVVNAPSPLVRSVRWYVRPESGGMRRLVFRARLRPTPLYSRGGLPCAWRLRSSSSSAASSRGSKASALRRWYSASTGLAADRSCRAVRICARA